MAQVLNENLIARDLEIEVFLIHLHRVGIRLWDQYSHTIVLFLEFSAVNALLKEKVYVVLIDLKFLLFCVLHLVDIEVDAGIFAKNLG